MVHAQRLGVGLTFPPQSDLDPVRFATMVEDAGLDSLWCGEHVANWGATHSVLPMLGAYAAATKRVTIGSAVLLLPLYHPTIVAKAAASIDVLSKGRLVLGVGQGGENPDEFLACGVDPSARFRRSSEAMAVLKGLWQPGPFSFEGDEFQLDRVELNLRPAQPAGPGLWVGGRGDGALQRALELGDGFLPYLYSQRRLEEATRKIDEYTEARERAGESFTLGLYQHTSIAPTVEEAREQALDHLRHTYGQNLREMVDRVCVLGPPAACAERFHRLAATGLDHLVVSLMGPPESVERQIELLATEVVPALHSLRTGGAR